MLVVESQTEPMLILATALLASCAAQDVPRSVSRVPS